MQVGIVSKQPKPASQPESRLFVRKTKSQCSNTPERKVMYSCAVPVTSARNNEQRRRGQLRVDVALSQDDIQDCSRDR